MFQRVHPTRVLQAGGTVDLGASLGCYRYMSRKPPGHVVLCPPAYSITLDPASSGPHVVVGVSFESSGSWADYAILRPGDTLVRSSPFQKFYVFAVDYADQLLDLVNQPGNAPLGYVGFLVGLDPSPLPKPGTDMLAVPAFRRVSPTSVASMIQAAPLTVGGLQVNPRANAVQATFTPGDCRVVRVWAYATNGGALVPTFSAALFTAWLTRANSQGVATPDLAETIDTPRLPVGLGANTLWHVPELLQGGTSGNGEPITGEITYSPLTFEVPRNALLGSVGIRAPFATGVWAPTAVDTVNVVVEGVR